MHKLYLPQDTNYLIFIGTVLYIINTKSKTPLHIQLYDALKDDIISHLKVGDKLPSIRKIVSLYTLSKTTVESAYSQLYAEGYIESRPKSGYYVSDFQFSSITSQNTLIPMKEQTTESHKYDFFPAQLNKEDFPLKLWKRLSTKAITQSLDFGSYHDGQGELTLREEIARYVINSRGVVCDAEQIVICHGFSDAIELLAKLVKDTYTHFSIENPGYHVARRAFEAYGYDINKIDVDTQGINIKDLQSSNPQIVYITPSHQYPTGVSMPISNRLKLIEYMQSIKGLIIEDDYDSELSYDTRPIPSLQGLDHYDCVVYMGTFSKSLSPALRLSYMVLPKHVVPLFKKSYDAHFPRVSLITQHTLTLFLAGGHYEKHVRKIRTLNMKKHNLMKKQFQEKLGDTFEILSQGGGLAILIMPTVPFDWDKFNVLAQEYSIKLYYAKERSGGNFEALRMGFGGFSEEKLVEAVDLFARVWLKALLSAPLSDSNSEEQHLVLKQTDS